MKPCGQRLPLWMISLLSLGLASCAWYPWVPGEGGPPPEIVSDPAKLSRPLVLGSPYVGELNCFEHRCLQRLRVAVDEPGVLSVTGHFDLASADDSARLVLESMTKGVVDRAATGRGPHADAPVVTVQHDAAQPGVYFILVQAIGSKVPYQVTANFTPSAVAPPAPPPPAPPSTQEEPPRLTKLDGGEGVGGRSFGAEYDPSVDFRALQTFAFAMPPSGPNVPAGTEVEKPVDREMRRYSADVLQMKGFRQAYGDEVADMVVGFSTSDATRTWFSFQFPGLYSTYGGANASVTGAWGPQIEVAPRQAIVVDIVDARTRRLAWHSWTTMGLGPGVIDGEARSKALREAVGKALAKFPPF